jgi:hypothetical protein
MEIFIRLLVRYWSTCVNEGTALTLTLHVANSAYVHFVCFLKHTLFP